MLVCNHSHSLSLSHTHSLSFSLSLSSLSFISIFLSLSLSHYLCLYLAQSRCLSLYLYLHKPHVVSCTCISHPSTSRHEKQCSHLSVLVNLTINRTRDDDDSSKCLHSSELTQVRSRTDRDANCLGCVCAAAAAATQTDTFWCVWTRRAGAHCTSDAPRLTRSFTLQKCNSIHSSRPASFESAVVSGCLFACSVCFVFRVRDSMRGVHSIASRHFVFAILHYTTRPKCLKSRLELVCLICKSRSRHFHNLESSPEREVANVGLSFDGVDHLDERIRFIDDRALVIKCVYFDRCNLLTSKQAVEMICSHART